MSDPRSMADVRRRLGSLSDDDLGGALRQLGTGIAYPSPLATTPDGPDLAVRVRQQIVASGADRAVTRRRRPFFAWPGLSRGGRPMRRSLVLAIAALLVLAAIVGAVGLGLPGIRIIFGDVPSPGPSPTTGPGASPSLGATPLGPLGSDLGLGSALPLDEVERLAGIDLLLPTDPAIGPPNVAYIAGSRATLVWATRPGLPATEVAGIGLLLSEFAGHVDPGYYNKVLDGETRLTRVTVNGSPGYWISGDPHFFFYIDPDGVPVDETRRFVGDTLIWSIGDVTYRLESGLDMDDAIALAESLR